MKFFTFTALLATALFSAVVSVPFLPKLQRDYFVLEVRASSSVSGALQVYYDDGAGLREALSARTTLKAGPEPAVYPLPLPPGTYGAFRLDPLEREGAVKISSLRVLTGSGRLIRELPLGELKPEQQIQSARVEGGALQIITAPGSDDPQLRIALSPALLVRVSWRDQARKILPLVVPTFLGVAALLLVLDRAPRIPVTLADRARRLAARPARVVWIVAGIAVIASAYPVVFLGKSYVSPNLGTTLLYDTFPTLPGYKSTETIDVKGSDIGAIMWSHIPLSMIQHRALAQGELPLWNRYNSMGTPLLAQGQSMFGDPLHFFVIACNGAAWAWDIKYLVAKWLFAAGLGLIVLAILGQQSSRPIGPEAGGTTALAAALIVTVAAPFFGFFIYRLNHPAFFSVCYAPWALYCWIRVTDATKRRALAGWAAGLIVANLALMNSGTAKEAYMLLLALNFSGACVLMASASPWRERAIKLAVLGWAGMIFVLLTAPVWATFLTTLHSAYTGYNAASAFQVQPSLLLGAFDEIFYRPIMAEERTFNPSVNFVILLGVLYFLATLRLSFSNRTAMAVAASSLPPLSLAFGLVSPTWIVTVPFLSNIAHLDNTFTCVLIVLWSVLAGVGFAQAAGRLGTREGRGDLLIVGLFLFALVFAWVGFRHAQHRSVYGTGLTFSPLAVGQTIPASPFVNAHLAALLAASVILAGVARSALARRRLGSAGAIAMLACAVAFLWRTGLHARAVGFNDYVFHPTQRTNFHARSAAIEFVRNAQKSEPSRGYGFNGNFFPGWTGTYGLEAIHGPDALVNPYVRELVGDLPGVTRIWDWRLYIEQQHAGLARPFLDALNVRYYFDLQSDQGLLGKALKLVKVADLDVYESPTAWPRAFFASQVEVYDQPAEFVRKIQTGDGRPFAAAQRNVLAAEPALAGLRRQFASRTIAAGTNYQLTENTTAFDVRASGPGVVVLSEAFWPGDFRAEVNGRRMAVLRLNHAFKGVFVPAAGDYHVIFRYVPRKFPQNLILCGLGAALLALSLYLALRWRKAQPA